MLVAALVSSSMNHVEAIKSLNTLTDTLCTTPTNIGEILRMLNHSKVFEKPPKLSKIYLTSGRQALGIFDLFLKGQSKEMIFGGPSVK